MKGYFQSNPFRQQSLKTFAKSKSVFHASIVPWNSPLKPILQKASNQLTELGMMDMEYYSYHIIDIIIINYMFHLSSANHNEYVEGDQIPKHS